MAATIAVTGATGQVGRRVARQLAAAGVAQRLVVRDPARLPGTLTAAPGVEVAVADYADVAALTTALTGTPTVFLVSGHEAADRMALHRGMVAAAAAAGVERIVYTSFLGAAPQASFTYAHDHALTERAIREAGLALTSLRNSLYGDYAAMLVGADGVIRGPAGDGRVAWVAREDVARIAVAALTDDAHADRIWDITGPEPITLARTAELLSAASGREIRYEPETLEQAWASRAGNPDWLIEGWIGSYTAIATGELGVTSHTIEAVTGIRPWSLAQLLRADPDSWAALAG
jgi:NAD(P)H dehydrogenase (quinone)